MTEKFHTSGEFSFIFRLKSAFFRQLRSFLIIIVVGAALICYLYFVQNLTFDRIPQLLVLMTNIWGLFLLITLLGYGLVAIPMKCWRQGSLDKTLETLQLQAVPLDETCVDTKYKLDQCVIQVMNMSSKIPQGSPLRRYFDIILSKCPQESIEHQQILQNSRRQTDETGNIEHKELVNLHKNLIDLISENQRSIW
jgi:hypothetical protein